MCKCSKSNEQNAHENIMEALENIQEHLDELEALIEVYGCQCSRGKNSCKECDIDKTSSCTCDECSSQCNCDL